MELRVFVDNDRRIVALDIKVARSLSEATEFNATLPEELNFDVFYQNYKNYSVNSNNTIYRHDENECLELKSRFIYRIRRLRKRALQYYDIYDKDCIKEKRTRSAEVENWYTTLCNLPQTYNNNIPYQEQIPKTPLDIKEYSVRYV